GLLCTATGVELREALGYLMFSSRRRHTRSKRDWSSDVCSSDLLRYIEPEDRRPLQGPAPAEHLGAERFDVSELDGLLAPGHEARSGERRVGRLCIYLALR